MNEVLEEAMQWDEASMNEEMLELEMMEWELE